MSATPATTPRPERGQELELTIDTLAHGGNGVARLEGYVVFVSGALPGDRVRAVVTKRKRAYAEARTVEILAPSPDRIEPVAPGHPGASWQVLSYERQLAIKAEQVEDALRRIGKLDGFAMEPMVPAEEHWRYRNKLEYSFGTGEDGTLLCGFHKPGSWEEIVHVEDDMLASEAVNGMRRRVVAWAREAGLGAYDRREQKGFLRNLVIREGRRTGDLQVRLVTSEGSLDGEEGLEAAATGAGLFWTRIETVGETTQGGATEHLAGAPQMREELTGLEYRVSPEAFFQTNTDMAEKLYAIAGEYADLKGYERVYDLFCGMGTIGLSLAPKAGEVWGLEIVEEAIGDAIANAKRNDLANTHFFAGDVRLALRELVERAGRPDLVVVDPPRSGLSQKVVRRIIETAPKRIVYVSCNPTTLAPNAAQLVEAGYTLTRVRPVDMFPQTPHIECVALLERAEAPA
jgi:23S rRNA (uracil1939-C5)-methyltransferase